MSESTDKISYVVEPPPGAFEALRDKIDQAEKWDNLRLRDEFAKIALVSNLERFNTALNDNLSAVYIHENIEEQFKNIGICAYIIADSMMEARKNVKE